VVVHGDARDEDVAPHGVSKQLGRLPHDPRHEAARVEDAVPRAALERLEVAVAVAAEVLGLGEEVRVRLPAREERDVVARREGGVDRVTAEELRPAEDEQPHAPYRAIAREIASTPKPSAATGTRSSALWIRGSGSKSCGSASGR